MPAKIKIRKIKKDNVSEGWNRREWAGMWAGRCSCGQTFQFWFFGAALGFGLEHLRRDHAKHT